MASLGTRIRAELMKILGREAEIEKAAAGTFVSRPVLNGQEWADWAAAAGVPMPVAAGDLHVTVMWSTTTVQMIPDCCPMVIDAKQGAFALLGTAEDAFALAFENWQLQDRNYRYRENGATPTFPTYRPHLTLSYDAAGFELDDAQLADAPEYIMLGAEVSTTIQGAEPADDQDPEGVDADDDGDYDDDANPLVIVVTVEQAAKALGREDLNPIDRTALYDISKGRPVTANVLKRLATVEADIEKGAKPAAKGDYGSHADAGYADPGYQSDGKPRYPLKKGGKLSKERIDAAGSYIGQAGNAAKYTAAQVASIKGKIDAAKKALGEGAAETKKSVLREKVVSMTTAMRDVLKSKQCAEVIKTKDEAHLIYAISNVYSIAGETVLDDAGEGFTTAAMEEFTADVLKRSKSSTWEHEGAPTNVVVQGLVLSDEVQKALGIDLGFECLVTATHFPDEEEWARAKAGPWEQSIAGRFWYVEEEQGA